MTRGFKGIWIPAELWLNEELNITLKVLLAEIDSLDTEDGCFATNAYFAKFMKCDKMYVSQLISKLKELGFITEESFDGRKRVLRSNLKKVFGAQVIVREAPIEEDAKNAATKTAEAIKVLREIPNFLEAWNDFKQHRVAIKAKMSKRAEELMLKDLLEYHGKGHDIVAAIHQSIKAGWKGIFPKVDGQNKFAKNSIKYSMVKSESDKRLKRKADGDLSTFLFGKVPPQSRDLEEAILGACMLERDALHSMADYLVPEIFYVEAHQKICTAILRLQKKNNEVDIMTVTEELRNSGELEEVGGAYFVTELTNRVAGGANIETHIRYVQQTFYLRELIRIGSESVKRAFELEDFIDIENFIYDELNKANEIIYRGKSFSLSKQLSKMVAMIEKAAKTSEGISGMETGIYEFDRNVGGLFGGELVIIASRPSMGKSALMCSLIKNQAVDRNIPVACFSAEMASSPLLRRITANVSDIDSEVLKHGMLNDEQWKRLVKATGTIDSAPIFIDDTPGINYRDLISRLKRLKAKHGIRVAYIDYLQLLTASRDESKNKNRDQVIGDISSALKGAARTLDIPVVCLCQLNRSVDQNKNKIPLLSDLRESGNIEQDADVVIFPYRPEYYGMEEGKDGESLKEVCNLIVAKNRDGQVFINKPIKTRCDLKFSRFSDWTLELKASGNGVAAKELPKDDLPF